jgi:hypothetical protein
MANYGTVNGGNTFFGARLHSYDWDQATVADRLAALVQATELIDQFDYLGYKKTVQEALDAIEAVDGDPTTDANKEVLRLAELAQPLEFPRGTATTDVPDEIEQATYLIAKALLGGRDPDMDLEALSTRGVQYGDVKTLYTRSGNHQEHTTHLIPSPQAWNLIRPFLRERNQFKLNRV